MNASHAQFHFHIKNLRVVTLTSRMRGGVFSMSVTVVDDTSLIVIPLQKKLEKDTIRVPRMLSPLPRDPDVRVTGNTITLVMMIGARRAITIKTKILQQRLYMATRRRRSSHRFERRYTDRALWIRKCTGPKGDCYL